MPDFERELRALGAELAFPRTPDLAAAVRARTAEPRPRRFAAGRPLTIVFAALAVAVGIAFAVPAARSAILHAFGIGGIRVELVDRLPEHPLRIARIPGRPTTLGAARDAVAFDFGVPAADGFDDPDRVYVGQEVPGGVVFLVYGPARRPRALLTAFEANGLIYASKSAGPRTRFRSVTVGGAAGAWLEGAPHTFAFRDRNGQFGAGTLRLATNTLIWRRGTVTYRLEGHLTLEQALDVANSLQ